MNKKVTYCMKKTDDIAAISCPEETEPREAAVERERVLTDREARAVERLITAHRPLLRRLCATQMNQREDAEDLESLCVMAVCRRYSSYDPSRGAFGTWLGKIVRNEASDWRRKTARQPKCLPSDEFTEAAIAQAVAKTYELAELPECPELEHLPEVLKTAFSLVKLNGLSSSEAATVMNTTDGTVRTYVWKARKLLMEMRTGGALDKEDLNDGFGLGEEGFGLEGSGDGRQQPVAAYRCA